LLPGKTRTPNFMWEYFQGNKGDWPILPASGFPWAIMKCKVDRWMSPFPIPRLSFF
jgi:hypothetical protein